MNSLFDFLTFLNGLFPTNLGIILALCVFAVVVSIFKFVIHADDEEARSKGRKAIFWGVVGVFIVLSFWGLVRVLINTIKLPEGAPKINGGIVPMPSNSN